MSFVHMVVVGIAVSLVSAGANAETRSVTEKSEFIALVNGQTLTRVGIRLNVTANGAILGRAFGQDVEGQWQWRDGYFCRDLFWGGRDLGANCQQVTIRGDTMRFTSDRGAGEYADLTLR